MKDDLDFNIDFVSLVESNPCIYDNTSPDYTKFAQDKAWEQIAGKISETVSDCKERWKNLRGCYTRHLKALNESSGSGAKTKRPYYLAEHLHFLRPFTKSRKSYSNSSTNLGPSLRTKPFEEYYSVINDPIDESEDAESEIGRITGTISPVSITSSGDINSRSSPTPKKRKANTPELNSEMVGDPDLAFLNSVLPDMKEMNINQKRRFKLGILNLAVQILDEDLSATMYLSSNKLMNQLKSINLITKDVNGMKLTWLR